MEPALILLDTNILIDVLRGEEVALRWLMAQGQASISVITWIEVLVGCRAEERERVETWLEGFRRWPVGDVLAGLPLATRVRWSWAAWCIPTGSESPSLASGGVGLHAAEGV